MIEVFSGTATLCSVAKQFGLDGSLALDKIRKKGAKATIFVFNILDPKDRDLCITGWNQILWYGLTLPQFAARAHERDKSGMEDLDRYGRTATKWACPI